ncbi:MAG: glycosyltransferase family 4 protein [Alsobacter sp.]
MAGQAASASATRQMLRILHVFRAPVGGLFRHVVDLAGAQADAGHAVGIVCDADGGERATATLASLEPRLQLGLARWPMPREPGPGDATALARFVSHQRRTSPDIVHGHGAKGGLYARLPAVIGIGRSAARLYTPHGGSAHYGAATLAGRLYGAIERLLVRGTDGFIFESTFARDRFATLLGRHDRPVHVVHNGLRPAEFTPITPVAAPADILFLGEMRRLKGIDVLIEALALLREKGAERSALLVGAGPDEAAFRAQVAALDLKTVAFSPPMPAREAFARARVMAVPSRAESLPYVILEAAAARLPLVASAVGGIPEIVPPGLGRLVPAGDAAALADSLTQALDAAPAEADAAAAALAAWVRERFSLEAMTAGIDAAYRTALQRAG